MLSPKSNSAYFFALIESHEKTRSASPKMYNLISMNFPASIDD